MDYYIKNKKFIIIDESFKDGLEIQTGQFNSSIKTKIIPWKETEEISKIKKSLNKYNKITKIQFEDEKIIQHHLINFSIEKFLIVDDIGDKTLYQWDTDPRKVGSYCSDDFIFMQVKKKNNIYSILLNKNQTFMLFNTEISGLNISYSNKREINPIFGTVEEIGFIRAIRNVLKKLDVRIREIRNKFASLGLRSIDLDSEDVIVIPLQQELESIDLNIKIEKEVTKQFFSLGIRFLDI